MLTLAIDTSTSLLSIALVADDKVLASIDEPTKNNQSEILMSRIETIINDCQLKPTDLEEIAVAIGPGSYTGIRVGVAAAKSLAYALDIPIVAISSLEVMAKSVASDKICVPMIDARRGTVFAGGYKDGELLIPEGHYELDALLSKLSDDKVTFVGDGALVHRERLLAISANVRVIAEVEFIRSKAEVLGKLASSRSTQKNIHLLIPNYLRKTEAEMNVGV